MDIRDTPEQAELRRTARRLARELGPQNVTDLDDGDRRKRLAEAVRNGGWLDLRGDGGSGDPLAGGVEAAIIAEALGEAVADVPFAGPILAADLARRAGMDGVDGAVVGFAPDLGAAAMAPDAVTESRVVTVDAGADGRSRAYVLVPDGDGYRVGLIEGEGVADGADLTRRLRALEPGLSIATPDQSRRLGRGDLDAWCALGLALAAADMVGVMRGVTDATVAYAKERRQYGVAIGTFQAVQHLLAEAACLIEGAVSVALYPAWAVDELEPDEALAAARAAKAYCARAARTVCETAVQVHGGIGNTWDCIVHVYLRRALLSTQWFGDEGEQLRELERQRLGTS